MKLLKRVALAAGLGAGLLGVSLVAAPDADAMKPRCGEQRDGTFDSRTYACGGAASNCTETTVCG